MWVYRRPYSERYGARDPLLAGWVRACVYLIWRTLFALLRPVVFLLLLSLSGAFGYRALLSAPESVLQTARPLSERVEFMLSDVMRMSGQTPEAMWIYMVNNALDVSADGAPDLPLAVSATRSLVWVVGRERLALSHLTEHRRPAFVEARLRALPAWRRSQTLQSILRPYEYQRDDSARLMPELALAPQLTRQRLNSAKQLYASTFEDAERWFSTPGERTLVLQALPGLVGDQQTPPPVYGDVRELVVQGCALARAMSVRVGQCQVGFLPKPAADPVRTALSLSSYGADSHGEGARLAAAAWSAGRLNHDYVSYLALGEDTELGRRALLTALMPILSQAGDVYTQPLRYRASAHRAMAEYSQSVQLDTQNRQNVFESLVRVSRSEGALTAIRVADTIVRPGQADQLAQLADITDGRLLALHSILGAQMVDRLFPPPVEGRGFKTRYIWLSIAMLVLALGLVFMVLASGLKRRRGGAPGLYERIDAKVSRLILGRNF